MMIRCIFAKKKAVAFATALINDLLFEDFGERRIALPEIKLVGAGHIVGLNDVDNQNDCNEDHTDNSGPTVELSLAGGAAFFTEVCVAGVAGNGSAHASLAFLKQKSNHKEQTHNQKGTQ